MFILNSLREELIFFIYDFIRPLIFQIFIIVEVLLLLGITYRNTFRSEAIFGNWKPFKNYEKCFLFHIKSSFRYQDIQVFVFIFWLCSKTAW